MKTLMARRGRWGKSTMLRSTAVSFFVMLNKVVFELKFAFHL